MDGVRRTRRLIRGRADEPGWARPALFALLVGAGVLYLWGLSANGWANEFYSAAVQAGATSWKAFLFGSSDAGNTITVDKPPASLWPMALSVRLFGLSPWSILVPQAVMGVATVGVVYATVRRSFGPGGGLLAGAALAVTPVAALMFRFNNPDALLVLLMAVAAYAVLRAVDDDRRRWFVLAGVALGLAFLTKQLQAFLVVPGFAVALVVAGAGPVWHRVRGLLIAGASFLASAGWWVALVELWPKGSRPYIGGSTDNTFLDLTFGYNGLNRLAGHGLGPGGLHGLFHIGGPFSSGAGVGRMFGGAVGGQIAWLMPAAAVGLVAGSWLTRRRPRTDGQRASLIVWGSWLVVSAAVFSFMGGIFHDYYTVALAPAVASLVGIGGSMFWRRRAQAPALATAALALGVSTWWARDLVGRAPDWHPWLVTAVTVGGTAATVTLLVLAALHGGGVAAPRTALPAASAFGLVALLAGPAAWTMQTVGTAHSGPNVIAGPLTGDGAVVQPTGGARGGKGTSVGPFGGGGMPGLLHGRLPGGWLRTGPDVGLPDRSFPGGRSPGGGFAAGWLPARGTAATPSSAVVAKLNEGADDYEWVAATIGATAAAPYQLATGRPVMPIGGFSGGDPAPSLEAFEGYVADGKIHWFIARGAPAIGFPAGRWPLAGAATPARPDADAGWSLGRGTGRSIVRVQIGSWVAENYRAVTVGGVTLYDLTDPIGG